MYSLLFLISFIASVGIFVVPRPLKYYFTMLIALVFAGTSSAMAVQCLMQGTPIVTEMGINGFLGGWALHLDALSSFFILVVNFTVITGLIYAKSYLKPYETNKTALSFSLHYAAYLWLMFSMVLVTMVYELYAFLVVWEIMTLASFILVIFDADNREVLKAGINYLIQMHVSFILLLTAFMIAGISSGDYSFNGVATYFESHQNWPLFMLFFAGFGIKAGFIPLHSWLPEAHPAAPSHVSGVMSGVMIKIGIYGILRVITCMTGDFLITGLIVLAIALISGILGVMLAIVQHDIKRLLAYHSIENIGIIGIGIGLGLIALGMGNQYIAFLGFAGALLHVLNHSLFKSVLFYNAGAIYQAIHTRTIDKMGGLIKKMPISAFLFLFAALAISGLPPFNGFISEFLIYSGLLNSFAGAGFYMSLVIIVSIIGLTLIGGLAVFCFTKAFGVMYLGQPRTKDTSNVKEAGLPVLVSQFLALGVMLFIGFGSPLLLPAASNIVSQSFGFLPAQDAVSQTSETLMGISLLSLVFVVSLALLYGIRNLAMARRVTASDVTWGCGYTAGNARQQYTATSYASNYGELAHPIVGGHIETQAIEPEDFFPKKRRFEKHYTDYIQKFVIMKPAAWFANLLKSSARMQTGQIQHYILYAFIFMIMVFVLSFFNVL